MTKAKKRKLLIINILSELSRNGWSGARHEDYAPLEKELRELEST